MTSLVRIANTGGLKPTAVELTSKPTGKKRMRTHYTPSPSVMDGEVSCSVYVDVHAAAETTPSFPRHSHSDSGHGHGVVAWT